MASCNFQSQLVSIMEILAKAAVAEINKRVDDSCAVIRLEVTQSQRDIDGLKRKCQMMEGELKKTRGRVRRKERSLYPVKIVLNKQRICSQWRDGEMAVEEDSQPQPTDVEQRAETEPILIKDEETAEDVWKTDLQEELRITGEESGSKPGQPPSFEQRHFDENFITQPNISPEDSVEHYPNSDGPKEPGTPRCTSVGKSKVFSTEQHRPAEDEDSQELVMVKDEKEEELDQTTALAGPDQFVMDETDGQRWTSVDPGRETDPEGHPDFSFHSTEEHSQNISIFPPHSGLPSLPTMTDGVGPSIHSSIGKPHANMFSTAAQMKRHVRTSADETRQQMPEGQSSEMLNSNNDGNSLALQPRQHQHKASEATVRMSECMTGSNMATTSTFSGYSLSRSSFNMVKRMRTQWRSGGTTERRFSCTFCGKSFQRFSQLKEHLRSHTGEKPYTCEQCGRSFTKQCNLIRHAVVHSGEKPYECTQCGKCFTQRSSMKSHQRTHIGESPVSQHVVPAYPGDPHTSLMLSQTRWNK
ncbi:zinc finger and SCAN domain-containing protein 2-like isoform X2 [Oncorhynchus kisutch]|uniref:zinc finger and SCAN domain-containing protein 2-like isoform X2 n=1 Tax=Oncorhynchus kisutch TaxID=8019 RepID=UPI0012DF610E|nr:zinc finger and SCAN domain-containing protein 2-like isoform X2 [Oncorhynchus kisutch]